MAENNIELKTVCELLDMKFFIPSYQRGYRWSEQQVKDILNDICDFTPKNNEWYCLQPLVVKSRGDNEWEVIDGQQRLTTIFLIIHYFNEKRIGKQKISEPTITYETRSDSSEFLKERKVDDNNEVEIDDSNIDFLHISSAYQTINEWEKEKEKIYKNDFQSKFQQKTKVIWYETYGDGREIFSRINIGKIALTNAELIKALFLNSSNFKTVSGIDQERIRLKQLEIATEWDNMEAELQQEEFWFFINKTENIKETRIEFIFELIVGKPEKTDDIYYTFREYAKRFTDNTEEVITESWEQVKFYFQTLKNWFNDRELYHKIGFLITVGKENEIKMLLEEKMKRSAADFHKFIDYKKEDEKDVRKIGMIQRLFEKIDIDSLEKRDDAKVRMVLLLHNIQTMLNNKTENTRFPFNRYKKKTNENKGWDVEHIHAIATKMPQKQEHQEEWLKYAKEMLSFILETEKNREFKTFTEKESENIRERIGRVEKFIETPYNAKSFETYFTEVSELLNGEDINDLSNLALLDLGTNRGYKNGFFSYKREVIIGKDKTNTFVPICTKNAFMKYYSPKIEQMTFWGENDRDAYFKDIKEVLTNYLPAKKEE